MIAFAVFEDMPEDDLLKILKKHDLVTTDEKGNPVNLITSVNQREHKKNALLKVPPETLQATLLQSMVEGLQSEEGVLFAKRHLTFRLVPVLVPPNHSCSDPFENISSQDQ